MKKSELTLDEIIELKAELNGRNLSETILVKGLLSETLPIKTKYWLSKLDTEITKKLKDFDFQRTELIKKLGVEDEEGNSSIAIKTEDGLENPNYVEFQKEIKELIEIKEEVYHTPFTFEMFEDLKTDTSYPVFFKLFEEIV